MEEKKRVKKEKIRLKERKQQLEKRRQEKAELAAEKKRQKEAKGIKEESVHGGQKRQLLNKNLRRAHYSLRKIELFETRLANGYDLTTDERYNTWLKVKCPGVDDGVQEASSGSTSLCQCIHKACRPN